MGEDSGCIGNRARLGRRCSEKEWGVVSGEGLKAEEEAQGGVLVGCGLAIMLGPGEEGDTVV